MSDHKVKTELKCLACGNDKLTLRFERRRDTVPFGPDFTYETQNYQCDTCAEVGDFGRVNDKLFLDAQKPALDESVRNMLATLTNNGNTLAYMERVLELPVRTMSRWQTGEYSASALALLRIITVFPFVLHVAEKNFDARVVKKLLLIEVGHVVVEEIDKLKE